jgi:hypothetical protein
LAGASLPREARPFLALLLVLGGGVLLWVWGRQERTAAGELLAMLALSSWSIPVMLAGKQGLDAALAPWGTFGLAFRLATIAVRAVLRPAPSHRGVRSFIDSTVATRAGLSSSSTGSVPA